MSRRVIKPLFSMSHIWKNSWVFSWIVLCPMPPFSHVPAFSPFPCLCCAVRATVLLMALIVSPGEVKAAMALVTCLLWERFPRASHEPGWDRGVEGHKILESFRQLYSGGSRQCHSLSSLSNHLCIKSLKPMRGTGGESSTEIQPLAQWKELMLFGMFVLQVTVESEL